MDLKDPIPIIGGDVDSSFPPISLSSLRLMNGLRTLAVYAAVETSLKYWGAKPAFSIFPEDYAAQVDSRSRTGCRGIREAGDKY